jgi:MraZ protein
MRLIGEFEQKIDEKNRVVLPSAFRSELENTKLMIAVGDDGELGVWPIDEWDARCDAIQSAEYSGEAEGKKFRKFTKNAQEVKLDAQFRFPISENLRRFGGLTEFGTSQALVIAGARNRLEIWEKSRYLAYFEEDGE